MYYDCRITGKSRLYIRQYCHGYNTNYFVIRCNKPQQQIASPGTHDDEQQQQAAALQLQQQQGSNTEKQQQKYITGRYKHILLVRRTAVYSSIILAYQVQVTCCKAHTAVPNKNKRRKKRYTHKKKRERSGGN